MEPLLPSKPLLSCLFVCASVCMFSYFPARVGMGKSLPEQDQVINGYATQETTPPPH